MFENIESAIRGLIAALQTVRLYPDWHPEFKKAVERSLAALKLVLDKRGEFVLGIVGEEFAFESEIFFELSKAVKPSIIYLKERGVERIIFYRNLNAEELGKFIVYLAVSKEEAPQAPQEALVSLGVRNITVGKISGQSQAVQDPQKTADRLSIYADSLNVVNSSLEAMLNGQSFDKLALKFTVTNVMENLLGQYQEFLNFATMKRYDLKTFSHIINVSILSMYFSSKLGFSKEEVGEIGTAALFHDIGKIYISRKIIRKPDKLTEQEFDKIRSHVLIGAEILLKYTDSLGILPVVVCFEHHLKFDLSGYPKTVFPRKQHVVSLIVSICDVYDALSQKRSYKSDYPPETIYRIMMRDNGTGFEPKLLERFFQVFGIWPVGTITALSDGRVAVVREVNERYIDSPKIEVLSREAEKEKIDLKTVNDKLKIVRSLNPLSEGKEYLPLI